MVNRLFSALKVVLLAAIFISQSAAAIDTLTASIDKNPVLVGEYFTLSIEADGKVSGERPDISELQKSFTVGPMSTSSRTNMINGSFSSSTTWQMQVLARRAGEVTIPAFTVAGVSSKPITVKVVERSQDAAEQKNIYVTGTLAEGPLYVQQAVLYTVKLFIGQELLEGQLSEPQATDATITQLGKQKEEYEVVDGRRYFVVTREYLVQPQKSGQLTLDGAVFNGQVRDGYRRMAASAIAPSLELDVQPIPDTYQGAWLPSELVHLGEEWKPSDQQVTVGTPITRTLTLTATGVTQEQLPDLTMPQVSGFRVYPDDSERKQLARDGRIISQLISSIALLPQHPGKYTLPAVKVPWFNTKLKRVEFATVPERTITVVADPNAPQLAVQQPQSSAPPLNTQDSTAPQAAASVASPAPIALQPTNAKTWQDWLLISGGYILWLVTLLLWWFKRQAPLASAAPASINVKPKVVDAPSALQKAAKQHDTRAFYQALVAGCQSHVGLSLSQWKQTLPNDTLKAEIAKLEASLYSSENQQADLTNLARLVVQHWQQQTHRQSGKDILDPLY
ncbi:BatD family protein [Pseudoalteromonas fenneropenaei]|uniref:BatD family protein n=1 Tax=Pseudoalteromonas fenneropenaei TaxID=1737459 RepID=A0ABV7CMV1_9GAMM